MYYLEIWNTRRNSYNNCYCFSGARLKSKGGRGKGAPFSLTNLLVLFDIKLCTCISLIIFKTSFLGLDALADSSRKIHILS